MDFDKDEMLADLLIINEKASLLYARGDLCDEDRCMVYMILLSTAKYAKQFLDMLEEG